MHLKGMPLKIRVCVLAAAGCWLSAWLYAAPIIAATTGEVAGDPADVRQERIVVSLPVFIAGILATAGFVWVVGSFVRSYDRRIDHVESQLASVRTDLATLSGKLDGLVAAMKRRDDGEDEEEG